MSEAEREHARRQTVAFLEMAESMQWWGLACELRTRGVARRIRRRFALWQADIYADRAASLAPDEPEIRWWRAYLDEQGRVSRD